MCRPPGIKEGFSSNFEVKCSDAMANPYNFLAGLIASGMDGLRRKLTLPEPIGMSPGSIDIPLAALITDFPFCLSFQMSILLTWLTIRWRGYLRASVQLLKLFRQMK